MSEPAKALPMELEATAKAVRPELDALVRRFMSKAAATVPEEIALEAMTLLVSDSIVSASVAIDRRDEVQALLRGASARVEMLNARGGALSANAVAHLLGKSKTAVINQYDDGTLLGIRIAKQNAILFPSWQFDAERQTSRSDVGRVLAVLAENETLDEWGRLAFFLTPRDSLKGKTPLELLDAGNTKRVVNLARDYVD